MIWVLLQQWRDRQKEITKNNEQIIRVYIASQKTRERKKSHFDVALIEFYWVLWKTLHIEIFSISFMDQYLMTEDDEDIVHLDSKRQKFHVCINFVIEFSIKM